MGARVLIIGIWYKAECPLGLGLHLRRHTWTGFVYVAFVIDAYARRIVGWRVSRTDTCELRCSMRWSRPSMIGGPSIAAGSYITAIERQPIRLDQIHRAVGGGGRRASVGSVGDSYDNAFAEMINGLYQAEIIHRRGPWRSLEAVEFATLEWVHWFNNRRLLEPIGNIPPAEAEERSYAMLEQPVMAA